MIDINVYIKGLACLNFTINKDYELYDHGNGVELCWLSSIKKPSNKKIEEAAKELNIDSDLL